MQCHFAFVLQGVWMNSSTLITTAVMPGLVSRKYPLETELEDDLILTDVETLISWMLRRYCSPRMAIFRRCSSFILRTCALCFSLGMDWSTCVCRALNCLHWVLHTSLYCRLILRSLSCYSIQRQKKNMNRVFTPEQSESHFKENVYVGT